MNFAGFGHFHGHLWCFLACQVTPQQCGDKAECPPSVSVSWVYINLASLIGVQCHLTNIAEVHR